MKQNSARFLLFTAILTLLSNCSSIDNHPDYGYLDDNLSDRWDLAKKMLGKDVLYFDTTNYGKIAKISNTAEIASENIKLKKTAQSELSSVLSDVNKIEGKLAISGISSSNAFQIIQNVFSGFEGDFRKNVRILYIGDNQFKAQIQKMVENRGATFLYAEKPKTSD